MITLEQLKKEAKRLKRSTPGLKHHEALDKVAKSHGYDNYRHAQRELGGNEGTK